MHNDTFQMAFAKLLMHRKLVSLRSADCLDLSQTGYYGFGLTADNCFENILTQHSIRYLKF